MSASALVELALIAVIVVALATVRRPVAGTGQRMQSQLTQLSRSGSSTEWRTNRTPHPTRRARRRRDVAVRAALADLCDVIGAGVRAGLNLSLSLEVAEELGPPVFTDALRSVRLRTDRGERLLGSLDQLPATLGDGVRPLTAMLQSAERDGIALARLIDALAADARRERRQHIERNARRLPVLLLGPLVGCVLPAFMILTVVPVVIASVLSLGA